jgi:hypothetical protein
VATWWSIKGDEADRKAVSPWAQAGIVSAVLGLAALYLLTPLRITWLLGSYGWLREFLRILLIHGM